MIRPSTSADAAHLARIYNHYVTNTPVTFEEQVLAPEEMLSRMHAVTSKGLPWLVSERLGEPDGYAYVSMWRDRSAYRFTVESTVYVAPEALGSGVGAELYAALFDALCGTDVHAVIAAIALPNPASVALHERFGFRKVAHLAEVGFKHGEWIDVGYWQRLL